LKTSLAHLAIAIYTQQANKQKINREVKKMKYYMLEEGISKADEELEEIARKVVSHVKRKWVIGSAISNEILGCIKGIKKYLVKYLADELKIEITIDEAAKIQEYIDIGNIKKAIDW